jgi:H+-transporting ATPase
VAALQEQLQVMVRVLRNGNWALLSSRELLPGDVVRIRMGDFLTADMQIIEGELKTDKSALTGETTLIENKPGDTIYAGSLAKAGEATAKITATGTQTFFGQTAKLVLTASHKMHMEEVVLKLVRILFLAVIIILLITTVIAILNGDSWLSILPLVLILLVSAIPIGLPAMFTISMARGSKTLAENGLLVTKLSATEDAATITTLCIDKTGTITKNELNLKETLAVENFSKEDVIKYGTMASVKANEDAIDLAFISEAEKLSFTTDSYRVLHFIPFNATIKHTEAEIEWNNQHIKVAKGAYEAIKELCGLSAFEMDQQVDEWAQKGYKTIAVAVADKEPSYHFIGMAALYDSPRPDTKEMIEKIKNLGIRLKMLTGDALPIAKEIAKEVGIGSNIVAMADVRPSFKNGDGNKSIQEHDGFAEVLPEDKFIIVKTLQQNGELVGMTGDGVNDAPALKQAEVGIAVKNATDVAKQAASIILLHEGLQQMLELIKVGRSIHVRISNYTVNKIAKTIQTILFVCIAFILTKQFVVGTIDMVLLLFLIDFVVLALAVDKVSWSTQPANWNIKPLVLKGAVLGIMLFIECIVWYFFAKSYFALSNEASTQSLGFACLFFSGILSILVIRTEKRFYQQAISQPLLLVILLDVLIVCGLLYIGVSGFSPLPVTAIAVTVIYFLVANLLINDTVKMLLQKKHKAASSMY